MSPTSNTQSHPEPDRVGQPLRLDGLTIVLPCFNEAENLRRRPLRDERCRALRQDA
jgi:hypothetical protein